MNATTVNVPLSKIDVPPNRIREADPEKVDELTVSLAEIGQLQPIELRPADDGRYLLNIGLHRLLATQRLGRTEIEAKIFDGSEAQARLREIDENLYRAELTPYDQAAFLAERRAIYEALNGPVKAGRPPQDDNSRKLRQLSFFDDVTGKFGLSRGTVERALKRWHKIYREAWQQIRGTPLAKNGSQLDALARVPTTQQGRVVDLLLQNEVKTVADAIARIRGDRIAAADPDEEQFNRLLTVWTKATNPNARKRFLQYLQDLGVVTITPARGRK